MDRHPPGPCEVTVSEEMALMCDAVDEARRLLERTLLALGEPKLQRALLRDVEIWLEEYR